MDQKILTATIGGVSMMLGTVASGAAAAFVQLLRNRAQQALEERAANEASWQARIKDLEDEVTGLKEDCQHRDTRIARLTEDLRWYVHDRLKDPTIWYDQADHIHQSMRLLEELS